MKVLTVKEAAGVLRVNVRTVRELCASGKLPAARIGYSWRITEEEIERFLRGQKERDDAVQ